MVPRALGFWLFDPLVRFVDDHHRGGTVPGRQVVDEHAGLDCRIEHDQLLARLHALMATIHKAIDYKTGETAADTTAERALEKGSGVCQDHAHVMISAARVLGLPARYVSGYLLMDGHVDQTASHAWADVHVQGIGWIGFDAANDICPDDRYVRLATGLCYRDAAPVSGLVVGRAAETMSVSIRVEAAGQSQSQSQS